MVDAAEPHPHRQLDHGGGGEELVQRGQRGHDRIEPRRRGRIMEGGTPIRGGPP
ncbi:hypothetical protein [Ornithinimicrobium kibberense]|uniref:hypothetical protein n=1 Tax=Ornithinimicrobium kibberense TaxID=282060 RepID=UPI00360F2883